MIEPHLTSVRNGLKRARRVFQSAIGRDVFARATLNCPKLYLGNQGASWCISPNGLSKNSIIYSFGVGHDISFDLALIAQFGTRVHAFDPTPRSIAWVKAQRIPAEFVFHEYGLGMRDGTATFHPPSNPNFVSYSMVAHESALNCGVEAPIYRLAAIMKMLGHERVDLLKMDIEGAEYPVISDILESKVDVRQIVVEFHHRWLEIGLNETRAAIRELNRAGYRIFDISPSGTEYSFLARPSY